MNKEEIQNIIDNLANSIFNTDWTKLLDYIKDLQKKAEVGEHYKNLYSSVKKQKDDVVEYIKYQLSNLDFKKEEDMKAKMLGSMILVMLEDKEC